MATGNHPGDEPGEKPIPEYSAEEMGIAGIRDELKESLTQIELDIYEEWRLEFSRWAFDRGKDPYFYDGYAKGSMYNILNRVEKFAAWVFQQDDFGFTVDFTEAHLDAYWHYVLRPNDNQLDSNRREMNNIALVLKHQGGEYEIPKSEKVYSKINKTRATGFEDFLTTRELDAIKTASLRYYSAPAYDTLTEEERDEWAAEIAQRIGKRKMDLTWDETTSYKIPSLVYVSRDVGFRPDEVTDSKMSWVRLDDDDDARLQIPKTEDAKEGKNNWRCYLSSESARLLDLWKQERAEDPMYDDSDAIWLNREGNPYNSTSLRRIMGNLMDEADIDSEDREQGWYMIRRGVGTEIANSQGLSAVMSQLRIKRIETARTYVQTDEPSIREWMNSR